MLRVEGLTVTHRDRLREKNVIENISFILKPGESLGIVGESGSGKTITALTVMQLLPPGMRITSGRVFLDDPSIQGGTGIVDLSALSEKQIRRYRGKVISMVFQEPMTSLNPSMRCGDQIREAVRLHAGLAAGDAKDEVFSLMQEVRLPPGKDFYRKYPHQLSGGQRQRIMIAMALAGNPRILIADEPTTALDVTVQRKILELLHEIRQNRGMSMLFVSHDLGVVRSVCENTLVMYRGVIVESGNVSEVFQSPEHPYTRGLIACRPVPGSDPWRLPTLADFMDREGQKVTRPDRAYTRAPSPDSRKVPEELPGNSLRSDETAIPLLEVRDLQVEYPLKKNFWGKPVRSLHAVDRFSFGIHPGETVGLIGESGCGKSSLGRSIIRLIRSGSGMILYRGKDVSSFRGQELRRYRQRVQFIFQDPYSSLNPRMAVGPSIMEVIKVHGILSGKHERENAVLELLGRVGLLPEHFQRYPHEFSGGQRQRIGLARALATGPELLICDESVSSLDVSVQAVILNLLNDLKEDFKLTYLFISHDLSIVRYMSDRILVMKDGKLVEEGSGQKIFADPSSGYTRELIDSIHY